MSHAPSFKVNFLDEEATGSICPVCDERVYMGAKRTSMPIRITYEDYTGLHQRTCQSGFCASCADLLKDQLP